jgi:hypothetical protein
MPCAQDKVCLTSSNHFLIQPEYPMKGSTGARSMSRTFPTDATPFPFAWINQLQLVTCLVDPIHDMWSIRVVTQTHVS